MDNALFDTAQPYQKGDSEEQEAADPEGAREEREAEEGEEIAEVRSAIT